MNLRASFKKQVGASRAGGASAGFNFLTDSIDVFATLIFLSSGNIRVTSSRKSENKRVQK